MYAVDSRACQPVAYRTLYHGSPKTGRTISQELYAYVLDGELSEGYRHPDQKLIRLLERVIRHADGGDYTFLPCTNGLAAYDEWIASFENGTVDPLGNASNIALYAWSREQAVKFWRERELDGLWKKTPQIQELIRRAMNRYDAVRLSFEALGQLFPFPHGGFPSELEVRELSVKLLHQAKKEESEALDILRELLSELRIAYFGQTSTPIHHISLSPFYSFGSNRNKRVPSLLNTAVVDGIVCMCSDLKKSMLFYGALFGIEPEPGRLNDPIALLPMRDDSYLVLMDRRLDLNHADWNPVFYIRVPDVTQTYECAINQEWTIINFLDKGGPFTDFFIAEDADGLQFMIGSHRLADSFPFAGPTSNGHPLLLPEAPYNISVKNVTSSSNAYCNLFGDPLDRFLQFTDKFGPPDSTARLQFEFADVRSAYQWLRNADITISKVLEGTGDGDISWVVHDPDGRNIVIRKRMS